MWIAKLAEYGVAVVSIGALVYTVNLFIKFLKGSMVRHIEDSARANQKLADSIQEMLTFLRIRNGKGG